MGRPALLIQLPVPQLVPQRCTGNVPMAAASLALHARRSGVTADAVPLMLPQELQIRAGDAALMAPIASMQPRLVGFTCTVWNIERTLHMARRIREMVPDATIVLGGPDVARDVWFVGDTRAPFDLAVEGEGESALAALLAGTPPEDLRGLLRPGGGLTEGGIDPGPLASLDTVHDPFIEGLVAPEPDGVMFVELSRGCAYQCDFCRYHQGRQRTGPAIRTSAQIAEVFAWARSHRIREIYLLDPSLEQRAGFDGFLDELARVNAARIPIFCELRAEGIDAGRAGRLRRAGVRSVEIGLQTVSAEALRLARRAMDRRKFAAGVNALRDAGITVRADVMLGLPGDTPQGLRETLEFVESLDLGMSTQLFRTQVLPGTDLRSRAVALGVRYEEKPPYFVLSTPTWPEDLMEESLSFAQEALDIDLIPEDRPLLPAPGWRESTRRDVGGATIIYGFDFDTMQGRESAESETFASAANAVTLWLRTRHPARDGDLSARVIRRLSEANAFSAITVVIEAPTGAPLNALDAAVEALEAHPVTRYADRMFGDPGGPRPGVRLLLAIDAGAVEAKHAGWIDAASEVAQIVWIARLQSPENLEAAVSRIRPMDDDYVFVDVAVKDTDRATAFEALRAAVEDPQLLLLPAPDLHWAWVDFLEGRG